MVAIWRDLKKEEEDASRSKKGAPLASNGFDTDGWAKHTENANNSQAPPTPDANSTEANPTQNDETEKKASSKSPG